MYTKNQGPTEIKKYTYFAKLYVDKVGIGI